MSMLLQDLLHGTTEVSPEGRARWEIMCSKSADSLNFFFPPPKWETPKKYNKLEGAAHRRHPSARATGAGGAILCYIVSACSWPPIHFSGCTPATLCPQQPLPARSALWSLDLELDLGSYVSGAHRAHVWHWKRRNLQRAHAQSPGAPEPVSRTERELFVAFWHNSIQVFPEDMSGPQLWCWLLRIVPLRGSGVFPVFFQTPLEERVLFTD